MKNPLFSIVIANYNYGKFLENAILSVLDQDCSDYELIIVDGGSSDNSVDIIKKYDSRLSWWISEKDNGQSHAFNKGFSHANGQFYFWLNADDELLPHTLCRAKLYLQKHPSCVWLAGNMILINVDDIILKCKRGPIIYIDFLIKYGVVYVYGPTAIFHKNLFENVGGFDEELHYTMDSDLWLKFIKRGYRFHRINHYCWAFRVHSSSKTSHAFNNKPSVVFAEERKKILLKNRHTNYKWAQILQSLFKIISGTYFLSFKDSFKYKGLNVKLINRVN